MSLYNVIYLSAAEKPMSEDELIDLLRKAREKNARLDVTGMLLYRNGYFIQVLEGEQSKVLELYKTISEDDRHHHVMTLQQGAIDKREFDNWEMGFNNLESVDADKLEGYTDFLEDPYKPGFAENPEHAHNLLLNFRDNPRF
jgi:hypothetical protein